METAQFGSTTIRLEKGDITQVDADAVVNAANASLLGGGGVDGAIHRAAGPELLEECKQLGGCETGNAKITGAGRMKARHVIHAVGPIYQNGRNREDKLLSSCYLRSLELALENGCKSIAFPSISTGAHRYPVAEASRVALRSVKQFCGEREGIETVVFVLFDGETLGEYAAALDEIAGE